MFYSLLPSLCLLLSSQSSPHRAARMGPQPRRKQDGKKESLGKYCFVFSGLKARKVGTEGSSCECSSRRSGGNLENMNPQTNGKLSSWDKNGFCGSSLFARTVRARVLREQHSAGEYLTTSSLGENVNKFIIYISLLEMLLKIYVAHYL